MNGHMNEIIKEWRNDVQYIILDDIHWKDIEPIAKGLLIAPWKIILTGRDFFAMAAQRRMLSTR